MVKMRASLGEVDLSLPPGPHLLEAAGRVALAHGQLELMLRMTIKTLTGMAVKEALYATEKTKNWQLREEIEKLFKQKTKELSLVLKLRAILNKCEALSAERNRLLHNAWAIAPDGSVVSKGLDHAWGPAATPDDLNNLAIAIIKQVEILNEARLHGLIKEVMASVPEKKAISPAPKATSQPRSTP